MTHGKSRFAAQVVDLAGAHFPPTLLRGSSAVALRELAPYLAPDRQLYFECRLAGPDRRIDVSQHFFAAQGGAKALAALARSHNQAEVWRRIEAFADRWREDRALADAIVEVGLEHDAGAGGDWSASPAIFAAFRTSAWDDRAAGRHFVETVTPDGLQGLDEMMMALDCARRLGLVPGRMIGAMLSRDAQLRCMVKGLAPALLRRFLTEIAWPGDVEALLALLAAPVLASNATRLVLGFAPELAADCGLEVIHGYDAAGIAARDALLDWLIGQGLADAGDVAALKQWPAAITPLNARAPWPDAMVAADLGGAVPSCFCSFINHVKLNVSDGCAPLAKAYLSLALVAGHA